MNELDDLGQAIRRELDPLPEMWVSQQRARVMERLAERPPVPRHYRTVSIACAAVALASVLAWTTLRAPGTESTSRTLVAGVMREPFRFEDGSVLSLAESARGRLTVDSALVRFDLESGRASFDVTPGQRRTWLIKAGENEVRVIGTRFSVSYAPSETFEVTVERGIVSVRVPERSASVELSAGERLLGRPGRLEVERRGSTREPVTRSPEVALPPAPVEPNPTTFPDPSPRLAPTTEPETNDEWRTRYRDGKYAESLALIRARGLDGRLNELDARTLADVADAARLGGNPDLAVRALTVLMRRFPGAPEARNGKFLLGRVQALRGNDAAAISAFEAYLKSRGSAQYANEAVGRLIELYSARGDGERARAMARRYLDDAPNGPYRRLASSLVRRTK